MKGRWRDWEHDSGECLPHKHGDLSVSHRSYLTVQEWWTMLIKPVLERRQQEDPGTSLASQPDQSREFWAN